jgi:hypothetical protein
LCKRLSIDYSDSMLSWKAGEHECDGPWAKVSLSNILTMYFIPLIFCLCIESI